MADTIRVNASLGSPLVIQQAGIAAPAAVADNISPLDLFGATYAQVAHDPVEAPQSANFVTIIINRSGLSGNKDIRAALCGFEVSLDGGKNWGGSFVDVSDGQVPLGHPLRVYATHGEVPDNFPEGMSPDSSIGIWLPNIGMSGVWVLNAGQKYEDGLPITVTSVLVRPTTGSKDDIDLGVSLVFEAREQPSRQLLKDVHHSVAFDAVTAGPNYNGVTGNVFDHIPVAGSGLYLRVPFPWTSILAATATITYASVSMTSAGFATHNSFQSTIFGRAEIWELNNPTAGQQTVSWTTTQAVFGGGLGAITYTGVAPSGPTSGTAVSHNNTAASTSPSITVNGTTSGNAVGDCIAVESGGGSPTAGQTGRTSGNVSGTGGGSEDTPAGGNKTLSWTITSAKTCQVAAEILAPSTGVNLTLVKGDLTLAGQTLSMQQGQVYTVVKADLTLAGQAVLNGSTVNFTLVKGDLILAGQVLSFQSGGTVNLTLVKGDLTLAGQVAGVARRILVIAPYQAADTIGTKSFQVYDIEGGVLTAIGGARTSGFTAIPNITNGWWVSIDVVPNGSFGDFSGIAVFSNINGTDKRAIELYSPPTVVPNALAAHKIAPFQAGDVITTPGYQLYDQNGAAFGSHVTAGIVAIPGVNNGYVTRLSLTPDAYYGAQYGIEWDGG